MSYIYQDPSQPGGMQVVGTTHGLPSDSSAGAIVAPTSPPATTNVGADTLFTFSSTVRHVMIQNNTSAAVYVDFDAVASQGDFEIYPGGQLGVFDVPCTVLHLWTAAAQNVNGSVAGGLVIRGWV